MNMEAFKDCKTWGDSEAVLEKTPTPILTEFVAKVKAAKEVLVDLTMRDNFILVQAESKLDWRSRNKS